MKPPSPDVVKRSVQEAAAILSGMGYHGPLGSIHLLSLDLQRNTITAIFHNMVAWRIGENDKNWVFHAKGGRTADLTCGEEGIQIKTTSDKSVKGNFVSKGDGYFIAVKYTVDHFTVIPKEALMGQLQGSDWERPAGTQWAFLKPEAERRLHRVTF